MGWFGVGLVRAPMVTGTSAIRLFDTAHTNSISTLLCWRHHPVGHFGGRNTGVGGLPRPSQPQIQPTNQRWQDQGNGEQRHSLPHTHSEWATGSAGYVPVHGSVITEDGECTTEFRTSLNRGQAIGASLQKIWKSHSMPISTKIRLMKALVWHSNVRLWKLGTQKEWRNTFWRLRWKGWERFCGFRGQQRKQMSGFLTTLE